MSTKTLNVVIAGGSLGGLIHGIVLARHGHSVTILERNPTNSMSGLGAGMSCSVDMVTFMSLYDLTGKPYTLDTKDMRFIDRQGSVVREGPPGYVQRSTNWDTLYYRLRANFDGLKSSYCDVPDRLEEQHGEGVYKDGCMVEELQYEEGGQHVRVVYRDTTGVVKEIEADLLIAADGPSSRVRQILLPDVERNYVGYIGWRGTVHENDISEESKEGLSEIPTLCPIDNSCSISYLIPGPSGSLEPGNRVFSWVWYRYCRFGSNEYKELMTDNITNEPHRYTLPLGRLVPEHATNLKALADKLLAPCVTELIQKTDQPFIQAITDLVSPQAAFCEGKVLLAGDALATLRPMSGLGTNSAARGAMRLLEVLEGKTSLEEWEKGALEFAQKSRKMGLDRSAGFNLAKSPEEAEEAQRRIERERSEVGSSSV